MNRTRIQRLLLFAAAAIIGALGIYLMAERPHSPQPVEQRAEEPTSSPSTAAAAAQAANETKVPPPATTKALQPPEPAKRPPAFVASMGMLPEVSLLDSAGNREASSTLCAPFGAIVLFLDLGSPACSLIALNWDTAIANTPERAPRLVGIIAARVDRIRDFRKTLGLHFPIYADPGHVYEKTHGVADFPLQLVVGPDGSVLEYSFDASAPADVDAVKLLLLRPRL